MIDRSSGTRQFEPKAERNFEWHPERSEAETHHGYGLRRDYQTNLWEIYLADGSKVPIPLRSSYTQKQFAIKAIDDHIKLTGTEK